MDPPEARPLVREATPADHEDIVALNRSVFGPREGAAVDHLLRHPGYGPGRWTVAADRDGGVVSCATSLPHTLRYGATPVPVVQVEYVATAPEHRRHGLVRAQFDLHHRWADEAGALLTFVTGIPFIYRRLGYGFGFEYADPVEVTTPPPTPAGIEVGPATADDVGALAALHRERTDRADVAVGTDEAAWSWLLAGAPRWDESLFVARRGPTIVGVARLQPRPEERHAEAQGAATDPDAAQALVAAVAARVGDLRLFLLAHHGDPWAVAARAAGHHDPARFNAVYARVPDLARFLDHIRPELSARLAASDRADTTGELVLGCYETGVVLSYADGEVTGVRPDPRPALDPLDDDGVGVPPDQVPALVLGRWGAEELERRIDDVGFVADRDLMAVLFPRLTVDLGDPLM